MKTGKEQRNTADGVETLKTLHPTLYAAFWGVLLLDIKFHLIILVATMMNHQVFEAEQLERERSDSESTAEEELIIYHPTTGEALDPDSI